MVEPASLDHRNLSLTVYRLEPPYGALQAVRDQAVLEPSCLTCGDIVVLGVERVALDSRAPNRSPPRARGTGRNSELEAAQRIAAILTDHVTRLRLRLPGHPIVLRIGRVPRRVPCGSGIMQPNSVCVASCWMARTRRRRFAGNSPAPGASRRISWRGFPPAASPSPNSAGSLPSRSSLPRSTTTPYIKPCAGLESGAPAPFAIISGRRACLPLASGAGWRRHSTPCCGVGVTPALCFRTLLNLATATRPLSATSWPACSALRQA